MSVGFDARATGVIYVDGANTPCSATCRSTPRPCSCQDVAMEDSERVGHDGTKTDFRLRASVLNLLHYREGSAGTRIKTKAWSPKPEALGSIAVRERTSGRPRPAVAALPSPRSARL